MEHFFIKTVSKSKFCYNIFLCSLLFIFELHFCFFFNAIHFSRPLLFAFLLFLLRQMPAIEKSVTVTEKVATKVNRLAQKIQYQMYV